MGDHLATVRAALDYGIGATSEPTYKAFALLDAALAIAALCNEVERLRDHIDAAGDGMNLVGLLDLYDDRRREAVAEVARLRAAIEYLTDANES